MERKDLVPNVDKSFFFPVRLFKFISEHHTQDKPSVYFLEVSSSAVESVAEKLFGLRLEPCTSCWQHNYQYCLKSFLSLELMVLTTECLSCSI